jgi:hypothetical protein
MTRYMWISAGFVVVGALLALVQYVWNPGDEAPMPWAFGPIVLSLGAFVVAVILGLARGTSLYRLATILALTSIMAIVVALVIPLDRGAAGPRPYPTNGDIVLAAGVLLALLSLTCGAMALAKGRGGPTARSLP